MAPAHRHEGVVLVVDVANVMGARPDGWWRDRAGAAERLLGEIAPLAGRAVVGPSGAPVHLERLVGVVEGQARGVPAPAGMEVVRAPRDGDQAIVDVVTALVAAGQPVLAVTADRGLRARLPPACAVAGPRWLLARAVPPQQLLP